MTPRNTNGNTGKKTEDTAALTTEDVPPADLYIDRMSPSQALAAMLANQAHAITALEAALPAIDAAADAVYQRLSTSDNGRLI